MKAKAKQYSGVAHPPAGGGRAVVNKYRMYSVYVIYNTKHKKVYIGQTADLQERVMQHNSKLFKDSFTARFDGKWELIYSEQAPSRHQALKREKQLKSYQGRKFIQSYIPG